MSVEPDLLRLPPERAAGAPSGLVAYSKLCTHAGCPLGLYLATTHELRCPCHQSTFDVLDGARPVYGPAPRPLPQLPIEIDDDGSLRALGDFTESGRARLLGAAVIVRRLVDGVDERLDATSFIKTNLRKVFPDHWSFMLGELALYSFAMLLLTGTFLSLFFVASPAETIYGARTCRCRAGTSRSPTSRCSGSRSRCEPAS